MNARIVTSLLGLAIGCVAIGCAGSAPTGPEKSAESGADALCVNHASEDEIAALFENAEPPDVPRRQILVEAILFVVPEGLEPQLVREIASSAVAFGFTSPEIGSVATPAALGLFAPPPKDPASDRTRPGPVQIALEALKGRSEARVVTLPSVVVEADHQAEITVGTKREPFTTEAATGTGTDVEEPEMTLRIVPRLLKGDNVKLEVEIRAAFLDVAERSNPTDAPPTTVAEFTMEVVIPQGSSILVRGLPLGRAFRDGVTTDVILTPTILE